MSNPTVDAIERNIQRAKGDVEFGQAIERLRQNRDFRRVVLEGFFEEEAVRLVHLKADYNMQAPEAQRSIVQQMDAIGSFKQFLDTALHRANLAGKSIEADEETRNELLAEDLNNG